MFCICSESCAGNTEMFLLPLSSADTESRLFCISPHLSSKEAGDAQEAGRRHSQNSRSKLTTVKFHALRHHDQHKRAGRGWVTCLRCLEWWCYLSKPSLSIRESCIPGEDWTSACPQKWWMNSIFCFACTCNFCFAY